MQQLTDRNLYAVDDKQYSQAESFRFMLNAHRKEAI